MSAALQVPGAVPGGQPPAQQQITSEMIMEIFGLEEEEAQRILQALPQLCQAATPQFQQAENIGAIQQGTDIQNYQDFLNIINSPMVTDEEREKINQLDHKTMYEIVTKTSILADAGTPTKNAMTRITWSDQAKTATAKQISEWILEVLMPRIIGPLMQGQEQIVQILTQQAQAQAQAQAAQQQQIPPGSPPPNQGPPQTQGQGQGQINYPWRNSSGDTIKYNFVTDAAGKQLMSDSLTMNVVKDTITIKDGILEADAVMTAAMVQTYIRDGKEQRVLKDPEELKKACDTWKIGMPCTDQHPEEGIVMNQYEITGFTAPPQWDAKTETVECRINLFDAKSIQKVQDGKTDVSIGFFCDLHDDSGTFRDEKYGHVQRNIVFNHLATGLDKGYGRCPDGKCGIQITGDCNHKNKKKQEKQDEEEINWDEYNHLPCVGDTHYDWLSQDMEEDEALTAEERKALPESDFCGPGRSFPVNDCAHYSAALRMLGRYQGPGDKSEIKDCIIDKGKTLSCPGAVDEEMTLHKQLLKEKMEALVKMTQKLAEGATTMKPEDLSELMDGIRELMWKLRDEIKIIKGRNISVSEPMMKDAVAAYGDAAILQHTITNQGPAEGKAVQEGKYRLEPGYPDTHDHFVTLDAEGNGTSTENNNHTHKVEKMVVKLTDGHSHQLIPQDTEEEPPMSDTEKTKDKKVDDKPKLDADGKPITPKEEPKDKAPSGDDKAEPIEEKPAEKDEASQYVEDMIKKEHTTLVDAIMDRKPPEEREFYEKKSLDDLKEITNLLDTVAAEGQTIPAGSGTRVSNDEVNDAYAALEKKLQDQ